MNTIYYLCEIEEDLQVAQKRVDDADNALNWSNIYLLESTCKANFTGKRKAEAELEAAREAHQELWERYQDACAWEAQSW